MESLPAEIQKRVDALKKLDAERCEVRSKFVEEQKALMRKYEGLYAPIYEKRAKVVSGEVEPEGATGKTDVVGIPEFWYTALSNHYAFASFVSDEDKPALLALRDITTALLDGEEKGFRIDFYFNSNDYFENDVLSKKYIMANEDEDEPILDHVEGCDIKWKEGKNLCVKTVTKKQKNKKGQTRTVTKEEPTDSFFNFFKALKIPSQEELEEMDNEEEDELQSKMEQDYELGCLIREKIVPNAVAWFTGEAAEEDFDFDGFGDDDEDEDDEGDDEEEEDDDEEEEAPRSKKKAAKKTAGPPEGQPECKQQ